MSVEFGPLTKAQPVHFHSNTSIVHRGIIVKFVELDHQIIVAFPCFSLLLALLEAREERAKVSCRQSKLLERDSDSDSATLEAAGAFE